MQPFSRTPLRLSPDPRGLSPPPPGAHIHSTKSTPVTSSVTPVLHLQPRIHFQKVELRSIDVINKFDRAGRSIADAFTKPHGRFQKCSPRRIVQPWRGRLLNHLLIASLRRAVAFSQRHYPPASVPENLHLDVPRSRDVLLQVQATGAEARLTSTARTAAYDSTSFRGTLAQPHPDPAAPRRTLEHQGEADRNSRRNRFLYRTQNARAR